jgi:RHS repeat-associated protein
MRLWKHFSCRPANRNRATVSQPARKRPAWRLLVERLEDRIAPAQAAAANAFAHFSGTITAAAQRDVIPVQVRAADFHLHGGKVLLGFAMRPTADSSLDPGLIQLVPQSGAKAKILLTRTDSVGDPTSLARETSLVIAQLTPGSFSLTVGSELKTTGAYVVDVFLVGDANADFQVDGQDLNLVKSLKRLRLGQPGYTVTADINRDGVIKYGAVGASDSQLARRDLGASTRLRPLTVTAGLDPSSDPNGDGVVYQADVTLVGQTLPGVQVGLDVSGTFAPLTTADGTGHYQFDTAVAVGTSSLLVEAEDSFGQSATTAVSVTREVPVHFADPYLEAAVRAALRLSPAQQVSRTNILNLTSLSVDSNQINSLVGLEWAANLQALSLLPGDWSIPGQVADLSPLSGLSKLQSLALVDAGISNGELAALSSLSGLQSLDLRYDAISDVSAVAGLASLSSLRLYADPVTDLSPLAGKLVTIDLPPNGADGAQTIPDLAKALQELPIEIFQYVLNNFTYQPYAGARKGAQAALVTRAGNDWDLDSLLVGLLGQAGVTTRYVTGTVDVPTPTVMSWLGVTDPGAAGLVLANAGLHPVQVLDSDNHSVSFRFDHAWVEAQLSVPGAGPQWVDLDPSWKFKDYQPGVSSVASLVPFDESGYLSQTRTELTYEYYENQVAAYLAANRPDVSLADVAHNGPIHPQALSALPAALPYTVLGATTTYTQIPDTLTHRVGLTLEQGGATLFQQVLSLPQMSLERVTVGYAPAGAGQLIPELLLGGQVVTQGPAVTNGSAVQLIIDHYDPGSDAVAQSFTYDRLAGQYLAVGLDAGQLGDAYLARQQRDINTAAIAARDNASFSVDDQVGAFLALAIATYFHNSDVADQVIDGLTHAVPVFNHVASGLATGEMTVDYHWDLQNPAIPRDANVDVANSFHQEFALDGDNSSDAMRQRLLGDDGSAEEHAVWEQVSNTTGISTVKSLQLANERGIPIFTIDGSNAATLIPQLTLDPSTVAAIQSQVDAGATVTVPRDPTPLNRWTGVGYIARRSSGNGFSEAYIIAGGLASESRVMLLGGSGTGDPNNPNTQPGNPDGNQTNAGDPVNIANGDVNQVETDFHLPGIGMSLDFTRRYDSQNSADVGLGVGWVFSYSDHLSFPGSGVVVWTDSQGHPYTFTPDGQGGFVTPPTIFGTLTASGSGYTYRDKNGLVHQFDLSGRLVTVSDRNGNALDVAYDTNGHITTVTEADAPERQLAFTYTGNHITGVSDGTGRSWLYVYSGGELVEVDAPSDAQTPQATVHYAYYTDVALDGLLSQATDPDGGTTHFTYYANRRAYQVTGPTGFTDTYSFNLYRNRTAFIDARDNATLYDYNSAGNLIGLRQPDLAGQTNVWQNGLKQSATDLFGRAEAFQYDSQGNITQITDAAGNVTTFTYEPVFNQLTSIMRPGGRVTQYAYEAHGNLTRITDALGGLTTMTYDAHGLLLSETTPKGNQSTTPSEFTTTFTYNDAGQVQSRSTALSSTDSLNYDARGHLVSVTDANGHRTTYAYDLLDRLLQTTDAAGGHVAYVYDVMGRLIASTDQLGHTTRYAYDPAGHLVQTTYADGAIATDTYDPAGNLITRTDELGRATTTIHDSRNRPVQTIFADGTSAQKRYDGGGRLIAAVDPLGNVTHFAYDTLGRLITTTNALGADQTRTYDAVGNLTSATDPLGRTTQFQYDLLNRQTAAIDPLGNTTTTAYDADGNVITVTDPLGHTTHYTYDVRERLTATTDALNQTTTWIYDAVGNLLSVTDPANNTTTYIYDVLNRKTSETDALNATETYTYDAVGNLTSVTDRDGRTTRYAYDLRNYQVSEQWLDATGNPIRTIRSNYDPAGELTAASDPDSGYTYQYDQRGRLATVPNRGTPGVADLVFAYTYDAAGNLVSVTDQTGEGGGGITSYVYDPLNRVTEITQTGSGVTDKRINLAYDAAGDVTTLSRFADLAGLQPVDTTSYNYDSDGRLTGQTESTGSVTIAQYQWTYDAASRLTQGTSSDGTTNYAYDNTNQLVAANSSSQANEAYSYDANGNRTNAGYQTGPDNRLLSDGQYTYAYDPQGNLIRRSRVSTGDVTEYTWDYRNRLTRVISRDGGGSVTQEVDYTYDVKNRLIAETVIPVGGAHNATVVRFVYNGDNIGLQFDGSGTLRHRYLYGPAVDQILADQGATGGVLWALVDNRGSVRDVIDSTGAVQNHIIYAGFGGKVSQTNPALGFLFGYTGRVFDQATGLQYNRARFYDPNTGRFISQDPLSFAGGDPNLYRYVTNQPTNGTDPTGHSFWDRYGPAITIGLIIAGTVTLAVLTDGVSLAVEAEVAADAGAATEEVVAAEEALTEAEVEAEAEAEAVDPNKLNHIFGNAEHGVDGLVDTFGSQENAYNAIQQATQGLVDQQGVTGVFEEVVNVGGQDVTVRGVVIDGVVRIGTAFIP